MKKSFPQKKPRATRRYLRGVTLAAILLAAAYWYWDRSIRMSPIQALAKAAPHCGMQPSEAGSSPLARPGILKLLERATGDPRISDWAFLCQGKILEGSKAREDAISRYSKVSKHSAAYLDAQLGLLRLRAYDAEDNNGSRLYELEKSIRATHRSDLLPELLLLQADEARRAGDFAMAKALYTSVREKHPRDEASDGARQAIQDLESNGQITISPADRLHEATLLLKEGHAEKALAELQQAKEAIQENTPSFFELQLTEERILRRLSRRTEADHVLAFISADAPPEIAATALLRMVKNAWNTNEHERALTLLERFNAQYSSSPQFDEASYVKARILEEKGSLYDAKQVYTELVSRSSDPERVLQALRQIAWIHYRENSFFQASLSFRAMEKRGIRELEEVRKGPQNQSTRLIREIRTAINHARYWLAKSLEKTDAAVRERSELSTLEPEEIIARLREDDPLSYYALLDAEADSLSSLLDKSDTCLPEIPASLEDRLRLLSEANLSLLAQFEIDSYFQETDAEARGETSRWTPSTDLVRAKLYHDYSNISRSLGLADLVIRKLSEQRKLRSHGCASVAIELSFPTPFTPLFSDSAERFKLKPSLLFAIARTESHFNPQAQSIKNAQGLLQLLPSTAKHEGWDEKTSLFEPEVNISLGAKHFSSLLKKYPSNLPQAIAAYNAGSTAVARWQSRHPDLPPTAWSELVGYPETKNYIRKVVRAERIYGALAGRK